jgi:hypothetical protein
LIVFDAEATYRTNETSSLTKASGRIPGAKSFVSDSSFINTLQVTSLLQLNKLDNKVLE